MTDLVGSRTIDRAGSGAPSRAARVLPAVFAGWTVFMWITRVRNAAKDDSLSTGGKTWAVGVATAFVAGGVALGVDEFRHRGWRVPRARATAVLGAFAIGSTLWWAVRSVLVLAHDHDAAFKVVHVTLAVITAALGLSAWRARVAADRSLAAD